MVFLYPIARPVINSLCNLLAFVLAATRAAHGRNRIHAIPHDTTLNGKNDMKKRCWSLLVFNLVAAGLYSLHAEHPYRHDHLALSIHGGSFSLEGPAVTSLPDGGEQDVDMIGLRVEGHKVLGGTWYTRTVIDASQLDDEVGLFLATISVGSIRSFAVSGAWNVDGFAHLGVEYARSSGLSGYPTDPSFDGTGTGRSGDDVGASLETGLSLGYKQSTRADLFAKYISYGGGDGPSFGVRLGHDLNEKWTLTGAWDGIWVEDDGIQIDQAFRRFSLGALRRF